MGHSQSTTPDVSPDAFDAIPDPLKIIPGWLAWLWKSGRGKTKPAKKPINPRTRKDADPTDRSTCGRFEEAVSVCRTGRYSGIGLAAREEDGLVFYDFDGARDPSTGEIHPWAAAIIQHLNTYAEISPSGRGLRAVIRGALPNGQHKHVERRDGVRLEIYTTGQFLTFTGRRLDGVPGTIATHADPLEFVRRASAAVPEGTRVTKTLTLADDELLTRARQSRDGEEFSKLFDRGDLGGVGGDHSAGDAALARKLAFWAAHDAAQMDRLFRRSKLMRPKWDERHHRDGSTYGQRHIADAIAATTTVYTPGAHTNGSPAERSNGARLAYDAEERRPVQLFELYMPRLDIVRDRGLIAVRNHLSVGYFRGHLQGQKDLAVFPLRQDGRCSWATITVPADDFDRVLQLVRLLEADRVTPVVIREDAARYTVTVFTVTAIPAKVLRAVLSAVATEAGFKTKAKLVPGVDNPTGTDAKAAGGTVALPYHGDLARSSDTGRRPTRRPEGCRVAIDLERQRELSLDEFLAHAESRRVPLEVIHEAAERLGIASVPEVARPSNSGGAGVQDDRNATRERRRGRGRLLSFLYRLLRRGKINGTDLVVAMEIDETAGADGVSWVPLEAMSKRLHVSRDTIMRARAKLARLKLLAPHERHRRGKRFRDVGHSLTVVRCGAAATATTATTAPPAGQTSGVPAGDAKHAHGGGRYPVSIQGVAKPRLSPSGTSTNPAVPRDGVAVLQLSHGSHICDSTDPVTRKADERDGGTVRAAQFRRRKRRS